ncbi:MAG: hypothetical protein PF489_08330 [Salinivirgaceae bacterium]|jgi:hypothetical protein|nr:hypothetical protein [Salinivirgaceae bacterium]
MRRTIQQIAPKGTIAKMQGTTSSLASAMASAPSGFICKFAALLLIGFSVFFSTGTIAQQLPKGNWDMFDVDILGNMYMCDNHTLIKADINGKPLANYENNFLGEIKQIDCFTGLKLLVFHNQSNTLVLLDKNLAPLGEAFDLNSAELYSVGAACLNSRDQIWVADMQQKQLLLFDNKMNTLEQGAVFGRYTSSNVIRQMVFRGGVLKLITDDNEILLFDQFGTFMSKHSFKELKHPFFSHRDILFSDGSQHLRFLHASLETDTIIPQTQSDNMLIESKNQLYLISGNSIKKLNK